MIDGLFKAGARTRMRRELIFPRTRNNKYRPGAVRELFGLTEGDFTSWKFQDWRKAGANKAIDICNDLLFIFSGNYQSTWNDPSRTAKATAVFKNWNENCAEELEKAVTGLERHRRTLEQEEARRPFALRPMTPRTPAGQPIHQPGQIPANSLPESPGLRLPSPQPHDLSPPPCRNAVSRPAHVCETRSLASTYFGVVVEGRAKSGKRYIVHEFVSSLAEQTRILWYNLTSDTVLRDVLARLQLVEPGLTIVAGQEISNLIEWLLSTSTLLVLDGLDRENNRSFSQLLRLTARLPGPCHIVACSHVKLGGENSHEIGPLTFEEATAFLRQLNIAHEPAEVRAAAADGTLWPYALTKAAALFGTVNSDHLAAATTILNNEIIAGLPSDDQNVMEVLHVINAEFDTAVVSEILHELQLDIPVHQLLDRLQSVFLVKQSSASTWQLESGTNEMSARHLPEGKLTEVLLRLARHYESKAVQNGRLPRELALGDCMHLFASCRLLQLAQADKRKREWLRNAFSRSLERFGAFRQLSFLYQYELEESGGADLWMQFRYARMLFATGKYEQALESIDTAFHTMIGALTERDEGLYISILRLLAEVLVELGHADMALKILDGSLERADIKEIEGTLAIQAVSVLSWALTKAGMPEACIDVNDDILNKRFEGLTLPFSRAVSDTRVGVACRQLGQLEESVTALGRASVFFRDVDARAYGWSTTNLAYSLHLSHQFDDAQTAVGNAVETNAANGLFNAEMASIYTMFLNDERYAELHPAIASEIERTAEYEAERQRVASDMPNSRLLQHVMLDLEIDAAEPYEFDKAKYELFSLTRPHSIRSKFNQNLIRRLRSVDVEPILDKIFANKSKEAIFRSPIYNRVIINAAKDIPVLGKKFINPFIELISKQVDGVLFSYARYFEAIGDIMNSELLLEHVRRKESFSYYNIKANCTSKTDPILALSLNDKAIEYCRFRQQKAQILNNKATIVYEHEMRLSFAEAMDWCEQSIRNATKSGFFWPRNLLLKFKLLTCEFDEIGSVVRGHVDRFHIGIPNLRKIVAEVKPRKRREEALRVVAALEPGE
ncbi:MAG: hypothetical protein H6907_10090 [Hyphomicrobiales bacterium]|nr:hypothetical protein [Hyphomicrobiales bacterium]MCP5372068.1 hypothetical protein [Hyphomicrobiales bacterium]